MNKPILRQHFSCWCFLILFNNVLSSSNRAENFQFCGQTLNLPDLHFTIDPSILSSFCCNLTIVQSSKDETINDFVTIHIESSQQLSSSMKFINGRNELIQFYPYSNSDRIQLKSDIHQYPISISLCPTEIDSFEIFIRKITRGPCKSNQYVCSANTQDQWCLDRSECCEGYHLCPQGMDEYGRQSKSVSRYSSKTERTISGGIVTTIIVIGLLLIVTSVTIALVFLLFRRKRRRRQFTYSLESTSDDWEPSSPGYHLFDNSTHHRRTTDNHIDNVIIDANEHVPIASGLAANR